jgi:hypothetical protein
MPYRSVRTCCAIADRIGQVADLVAMPRYLRRDRIVRSSRRVCLRAARRTRSSCAPLWRSAIQARMSSRPRTNSGSGRCARTSCVKSRQYRSERTALSVASKSSARASSRAPIPDRPHAYETGSLRRGGAGRLGCRRVRPRHAVPTSRRRPGSGWPCRAVGPRGERLRPCAARWARASRCCRQAARESSWRLCVRGGSGGHVRPSAAPRSGRVGRRAAYDRTAAAVVCPRAPQKRTPRSPQPRGRRVASR